jgi:hypothetical protein
MDGNLCIWSEHGNMVEGDLFSIPAHLAIRNHRVPTPSPLSLVVAQAGRNHLKEEITPGLPTGVGERYSQTISYLGHAALLGRCELTL